MISINFHRIRPLEGDQRYGFEEFICQLARREDAYKGWEFRRVEGAGGDGGVECYWLLGDGTEHGYQAKYFLATKDIDWGQIDKSVKSALEQHPKLTRYTIALACDLTDRSGKEGKGKTGWEHWKKHKLEWEKWAKDKGMTVEFVHWTKSEIIGKLTSDPTRRGLTLFWFDAELLDDEWFREHFSRSQADLDDRYHPEDHVRLSLEEAFGGLARSQTYLQFLHKWFSAIPSSADIIQKFRGYGMPLDENLLSTLCQACDDLYRIDESLDEYGVNEFPITDWVSTLLRASKAVGLIQKEIEVSDGFRTTHDKHDAARYLGEIDRHLDTTPFHLAGGQHKLHVEADLRRILLVVGEAGSGKSHLFASAVNSMLSAGMRGLLLLGQYFQGTNLRQDFLHAVGMGNRGLDEVLGALNSAGETSRTRLVLLIDALNEADNLRIWGAQLAGFVDDVLRYEWLAIGLSVRPEYQEILVPATVRNRCAQAMCGGVLLPDEQEQAAVQYFEKRGITRPAVPWLAPEFSNFLFLRTCCDSLKEQGVREFPRGLRGSLHVLKFYVDSIHHKLKASFPETEIPSDAVGRSLRAIANLMASDKVDYVFRERAVELCAREFGHRGPNPGMDWFRLLTGEGIFRKDHLFDPNSDDPLVGNQDVFRFTYQRFSDHLIVESLLRDVIDIHNAFNPDGPLGFIFNSVRDWYWQSLIGALAVQIPEKYIGVELPDIVQSWLEKPLHAHILVNAFKESLLWRSDSAFTERTWELFNRLATDWDDPRQDILIRLATLQTHPWNANRLDQSLKRFSMPERDALWTVSINQMVDNESLAIWELIRWSTTAKLELAETETLRLAAIALAWSLTSSNRLIRDKATKALSSIFSNRPEVLPGIVRNFSDVDDLYVVERVCAAALGAVTHGIRNEYITTAVEAVYESVFKRDTPHLHIILRDYARAIVEYAEYLGCLGTEIDLAKCRPPYHSSWPLTDITEDELKAIAERAGDTQILHSSQQMMGDFGTYEIAPLMNHFTSIPLNEPRPLSSEEIDDIFRKELSTWSKRKQSMYTALEEAVKAERKMHWLRFLDVNDHDDRSPQQLVEFIQQSERELLTALSTQERDAYERFAVPSLFPDRASSTYKSLPTFDAQFAQRWVALRAYEYGWTSRLFPNDHGEYLNRNRPMIERIGKKYQWLALFELAARLSDNVWAIGGWPEKAMVYDHPASHWFLRDVEPTLLMSPVDQVPNNTWWQAVPLVLDPIDNNDIGEWPFHDAPPSESDWLDVIAPDGRPWTLLYGYFSIHEDRSIAERVELARLRDSFVRITTIVIPSKHVKKVVTLLQDLRLADPSDHDTVDITDGPFLCEYGWRNTWWSDVDLFEEGFRNLSNITYMRPTSRHLWESHLDASLPDGSSICIPGQWLASRLSLRPHPTRPWEFITKEGEFVFIDPSLGAKSITALVDKGAFLQALKAEGLECLWIVAGEKSSYPSGHHGDYSSRSFAGVYRWVRGKWTGSQWHMDERGRPRG